VVEILLRDSGGEGIAALVAEIRSRAADPNVVVAPGAVRIPPEGRLSMAERAEVLAGLLARMDA
jgi:hypothetical protein